MKVEEDSHSLRGDKWERFDFSVLRTRGKGNRGKVREIVYLKEKTPSKTSRRAER